MRWRSIRPISSSGILARAWAWLTAEPAPLAPLLPRVFNTLPSAAVEIRRVPPAIELGAPGGYYQAASLDGSRPGAYYINLSNTANWPKWGLPTLTYHEAVPGHHFQIALAIENTELPAFMPAVAPAAVAA